MLTSLVSISLVLAGVRVIEYDGVVPFVLVVVPFVHGVVPLVLEVKPVVLYLVLPMRPQEGTVGLNHRTLATWTTQ